MDNKELEAAYNDLTERLNDFLIGSAQPVHVCMGSMASCIVQASSMVAESIDLDTADQEFYSLINAMEAAYAGATEELRSGAPNGETLQ